MRKKLKTNEEFADDVIVVGIALSAEYVFGRREEAELLSLRILMVGNGISPPKYCFSWKVVMC